MRISTLARALLFVAVAACTSEETVGPDGAIDYAGTWSGTIGDPTQVQRLNVTWTPTHEHNTVTGPIVFHLNQTLTVRGTLTGTVSGTSIDFTLSILAGAYPAPVSQGCALTGTGSSTTATATDIVANFTMIWTAPCIGTVTSAGNATNRLTLVKID